MTNYNERLDEILKDIIHIGYVSGYNQVAHEARISPYNHIEPLTIAEAKQAITSLIKELVAEARIDELERLLRPFLNKRVYGVNAELTINAHNRIVTLKGDDK